MAAGRARCVRIYVDRNDLDVFVCVAGSVYLKPVIDHLRRSGVRCFFRNHTWYVDIDPDVSNLQFLADLIKRNYPDARVVVDTRHAAHIAKFRLSFYSRRSRRSN